MKELLITSGFPRSGNTYINYALNLLYYPKEEVNWNRHTVLAIEQTNKIIVPFRNPIDAIASWHKYPSDGHLDSDISFYIRFYSAVLNNLEKVIFMDFNYFIKDLNYIKNKVFTNFGIGAVAETTDAKIKEAMLVNGKEINLPRNNQEKLEAAKIALVEIPEFQNCLDLYAQLKNCA